MIYGIHRNTTPPAGGIPPRKSAPQAASFRAADRASPFSRARLRSPSSSSIMMLSDA